MRHFINPLCGAVLALFCTALNAAPVTLEFTGVIRSSANLADIGKTFTGFVTYDASNIETTYSQGGSNQAWFGITQSGCGKYVDGVCTQDSGSGQPVVTDYRIEWEGGVIRPWDYSLAFFDSTQRYHTFDPGPGRVGWGVSRSQSRSDVQGDFSAAPRVVTTTALNFDLRVSSMNEALVSDAFDNFAQQFYTDKTTGLFFADSYLQMAQQRTVETCTAPNVCSTVQDASNYNFSGIVKVARFRTQVLPVTIDIKPTAKTSVNTINLAKDRTIDVAIKASQAFEVAQVDAGTVVFGPSAAVASRYQYRDYNVDGFIDVVFTFVLSQTGIKCGDTSATLSGKTVGPPVVGIEGADAFATIGCP